MNIRLKRFRCLLIATLSLSTPLGAQFFDQATIRAGGTVELGDEEQHPKRLTLSMVASEKHPIQNICVSYSKFHDLNDRDSRIKASCEVWRGDQLVTSQRFNGKVEFDALDGITWGYSTFCGCKELPLIPLEAGDVLQCDIRFRRLPVIEGDEPVSTSIALVDDGREWCQ